MESFNFEEEFDIKPAGFLPPQEELKPNNFVTRDEVRQIVEAYFRELEKRVRL